MVAKSQAKNRYPNSLPHDLLQRKHPEGLEFRVYSERIGCALRESVHARGLASGATGPANRRGTTAKSCAVWSQMICHCALML